MVRVAGYVIAGCQFWTVLWAVFGDILKHVFQSLFISLYSVEIKTSKTIMQSSN